jgi:membrane protease subunit HflC
MNRLLGPVLIAVAIVLFLMANTFFIVPQTQQALVLQFGEARRVINRTGTNQPGLYVKAPFIQNVILFDKRNLGFNLAEQTIIAADQERLVVDAYARWRVTDPLRFYQALQSETAAVNRLENLMTGALRRVLGAVEQNDIISSRRGELMRLIAKDMNRETAALGVEVIDVRIRQADLPQETAERVFERMRTERQQEASRIRAEGEEQSLRIRAEADKTVTVTLAEAREQAEKTRGAGDADRTRIFAQSYGRDPEFAAFYRSMQAYERAVPQGTQMVIPPDGEFFRYMRDQDGR